MKAVCTYLGEIRVQSRVILQTFSGPVSEIAIALPHGYIVHSAKEEN